MRFVDMREGVEGRQDASWALTRPAFLPHPVDALSKHPFWREARSSHPPNLTSLTRLTALSRLSMSRCTVDISSKRTPPDYLLSTRMMLRKRISARVASGLPRVRVT